MRIATRSARRVPRPAGTRSQRTGPSSGAASLRPPASGVSFVDQQRPGSRIARQAVQPCSDAATGVPDTAGLLAQVRQEALASLRRARFELRAVRDQAWWVPAAPDLLRRVDYWFACPSPADLATLVATIDAVLGRPLPDMECLDQPCNATRLSAVPHQIRPRGDVLLVCPQLLAQHDVRGLAGRLIQVAAQNIGLRPEVTARDDVAAGRPASWLVANANAYAHFAIESPPGDPPCQTRLRLPQPPPVAGPRSQPGVPGRYWPGATPSQTVWVVDTGSELVWSEAHRPGSRPHETYRDPRTQSRYFLYRGSRYELRPDGRAVFVGEN